MTHAASPYEALYRDLERAFGERAERDAPMSERINFRVGGPADMLVAPTDVVGLQTLFRLIDGTGVPIFILASGTNLVVRDGGIRGVVIDMTRGFDELEFSPGPDGATHLRVGAARQVRDVVEACAERSLAGMEWGAGIPGTVGGGIKGNAGTRDGDFAGTLVEVAMVHPGGEHRVYARDELRFEYRGLAMDRPFIVVRALLRLRDGDGAAIRKAIDDMIAWRYQRQPYEMPSAGSIFKNPDHAPAGRLIDQAGLKGTRVGNAMVSDVHTNFIVNLGGARAADIIELIGIVKARVLEVHGVELKTEVILVGEDPESNDRANESEDRHVER